MIPMFTLGFIIAPIAITVLAFITPIAVIFSKTAREAAIAKMKKGKQFYSSRKTSVNICNVVV